MECAKKEFLEKGYTDASLRTIAAEAETSTNSIYVRFKDKEGLFAAIVEPVSEEFISRCLNVQETFHDFVDRLVAMEEEYTWKWIEATGSRLEPEGELTTEFYHMMVTAYFEGIFGNRRGRNGGNKISS